MAHSLGKIISALFDLGLAAVFVVTWWNPGAGLARPVEWLVLIMLIEFITVHSSAMLGSVWMSEESRDKRLRTVALMTGLYALFVGAFSAGFSTWAPFVGFWLLTANRLSGMLLGGKPDAAMKKESERQWARSVALYLFGAFGTTFLPIPRFGLTSDVMDTIDLPSSGLWVEEPWRVLAFGALYFGLGGVFQLRDVVRRQSASEETADEAKADVRIGD